MCNRQVKNPRPSGETSEEASEWEETSEEEVASDSEDEVASDSEEEAASDLEEEVAPKGDETSEGE